MKLSVEIEPPRGIYTSIEEKNKSIEDQIVDYVGRVELLSITNRPVFGLSALTMAKRVQHIVRKHSKSQVRVSLHLTTRVSHFDMFRIVLDAHRMQLTDLLPILGDPRGPADLNYFENGFDILGFISYLKTGRIETLSNRYQKMLVNGGLVEPIKQSSFQVGSVIDLNPYKILPNQKKVNIRAKQERYAMRKEQLGAEYLISQGIFNADYYFDFIDNVDLKIPILAGIMPARLRLIDAFGILIGDLEKSTLRAQFTTDEERIEGNKIARKVYEDLKDRGCNQVHVYSVGNSQNFFDITGLSNDDPLSNHINYEDKKNKEPIELEKKKFNIKESKL